MAPNLVRPWPIPSVPPSVNAADGDLQVQSKLRWREKYVFWVHEATVCPTIGYYLHMPTNFEGSSIELVNEACTWAFHAERPMNGDRPSGPAIWTGHAVITFRTKHLAGWIITTRFDWDEGDLVFTEFGIRSEHPTSMGITTTLMRSLPAAQIEQTCRKILVDREGPFSIAAKKWGPLQIRRPGRQGRGDLYYAQIASQYVELLGTKVKQPTVIMAERLYVSPTSVRGCLHKARQRGLLTNSPPGKAGGHLTEKAEEILNGAR